jgi:hypothetical protein
VPRATTAKANVAAVMAEALNFIENLLEKILMNFRTPPDRPGVTL